MLADVLPDVRPNPVPVPDEGWLAGVRAINSGSRFLPHPQHLTILHLILVDRSESLLNVMKDSLVVKKQVP